MDREQNTERLPPIAPEDRTPAQQEAVRLLSATPRGGVRGPFQAMLYSPEFLNRTQALGAFLRYECSLPQRLRELAILVTARFWRQGYEWSMHAPIAAKAGLASETVDAIGGGRAPVSLEADEEIVFRFCTELHSQHFVPDDIYALATAQFGNAGVVELMGLCGYYALLAMVMNTARTPVPAGASLPFSSPEE